MTPTTTQTSSVSLTFSTQVFARTATLPTVSVPAVSICTSWQRQFPSPMCTKASFVPRWVVSIRFWMRLASSSALWTHLLEQWKDCTKKSESWRQRIWKTELTSTSRSLYWSNIVVSRFFEKFQWGEIDPHSDDAADIVESEWSKMLAFAEWKFRWDRPSLSPDTPEFWFKLLVIFRTAPLPNYFFCKYHLTIMTLQCILAWGLSKTALFAFDAKKQRWMSKAGCLPSFIWLQWFDNFTLGTLPSYNLQHGVRAIKMMILPAMFSQLCEQYLAALLLPLPRGSSACRVFLGSIFLWLLRSDAITNAPCNQFYKCIALFQSRLLYLLRSLRRAEKLWVRLPG